MRVLEYLETHSFDDLTREHGVNVSVAKCGYKASLNYDQRLSREDDPLASECRGLVIATRDGRKLPLFGPVKHCFPMARAFDRFFNLGTPNAPALDVTDEFTYVFEKLDGTLCIVYFDDHAGEWCVATRSVPDADRPMSGWLHGETNMTFRNLFERTLKETYGVSFDRFTSSLNDSFSYAYELTTPWNQVVVRQDQCKLHLLGMRDLPGNEICPYTDGNHPLPLAPRHAIKSEAELLKFVGSRSHTEAEGVVVRMGDYHWRGPFRRVKIKSVAYVAATRMKESVGSSPRSMLEAVLIGNDDDVSPLLPKPLQNEIRNIRERYIALEKRHDDAWEDLIDVAGPNFSRKNVALSVQAAGLMLAPMMDRYAGRVNRFREWVDKNREERGWTDAFLDGLLRQMYKGSGGNATAGHL